MFIVDDHRLFNQAMKLLLRGEEANQVVGAAETGEGALEFCRESPVDVALVDIDLPGMDGIAATRLLRELQPGPQVVVITAFQQPEVIAEAVRAGACGYIVKTDVADTLVGAIRLATAGKMVLPAGNLSRMVSPFRPPPPQSQARQAEESPLTDREIQILEAVADGKSTFQMAEAFLISVSTVRSHVKSILSKLGVHSKAEAVMKAVRLGLISGGAATR